jgi:hypothetical protein
LPATALIGDVVQKEVCRKTIGEPSLPEPVSGSLIDLVGKRIRVIGSQQNGPEYLYEALDLQRKEK